MFAALLHKQCDLGQFPDLSEPSFPPYKVNNTAHLKIFFEDQAYTKHCACLIVKHSPNAGSLLFLLNKFGGFVLSLQKTSFILHFRTRPSSRHLVMTHSSSSLFRTVFLECPIPHACLLPHCPLSTGVRTVLNAPLTGGGLSGAHLGPISTHMALQGKPQVCRLRAGPTV